MTRPALIEDRAYWIEYANKLEQRIEELTTERDSFKRMVMMPGQTIALRLMDAEQQIEELTREVHFYRSGMK